MIILIGLLPFSALGQVDTIEVYSAAMDKYLKVGVTLPEGYDDYQEAKYPTVYVLHGGSGQFSDWHMKVSEPGLLPRLANQYGFILITPGVGPSSYYYDSPKMDTVKYETYIIKELIPVIDDRYRTLAKREARAITGLSMGGHGAITLSAKHPELFSVAGSMSGVMNIDTRKWKVGEEFSNLRRKQQYEMLGDIDYDAPFSEYTAVGLAEKMKKNGIALIIDCGTDDFLIDTNRQLHEMLLVNETPHEYTERPGAHTWEYWTKALPFHMLFIHQVFVGNSVK